MTPLVLADDLEKIIPILAVGGSFAVAIIAIVFGTIKSVFRSKHIEESRREIAAYVAEGSISAEDAGRLMAAGRPKWEQACGWKT